MAASTVLALVNYGFVLLYGASLSVSFSGGCRPGRDRRAMLCLCVILIGIQILCWQLFGFALTKIIYPAISHLPLWVGLVVLLKKKPGVALVSVLTAYFCCQLPRWVGTVALFAFDTPLSYQLAYMLSVFPLYYLLRKYFAEAAYTAMSYSRHSLLLFGGLPLVYYLFDYATTVYTDALYTGIRMLSEFLPAAMALFYMVFVTAYHREVQMRTQTELHNSLLAMELSAADRQTHALITSQEQAATYRHDMRHHLAMISGYLKSGDAEKAAQYIASVESDIQRITPLHFCENMPANLILSAFAQRAEQLGVDFSAEANIPAQPGLSETELCALLSNGLENAVTAAAAYRGQGERLVRVNCQPHKGNLLLFISNPYDGQIAMADGLPQSPQENHGFGVKSIRAIADKHNGYCSFVPQDGIFTLKVVLPMAPSPSPDTP